MIKIIDDKFDISFNKEGESSFIIISNFRLPSISVY